MKMSLEQPSFLAEAINNAEDGQGFIGLTAPGDRSARPGKLGDAGNEYGEAIRRRLFSQIHISKRRKAKERRRKDTRQRMAFPADVVLSKRCFLFYCGLFAVFFPPPSEGWLSTTIDRVAGDIEEKLTHFISSTTGFEVLEEAYNDSKSRINFQPVNGDDLVADIAKSFGDLFGRKIESLQLALKHARDLTKKYQWNSKLKEADVNYFHARELDQFSDPFTSSDQYGKQVSLENSSVHIPVDIFKGDVEILNSLAWTAGMDQVWKENKERDPGLLWQYFGSQSGLLRIYPASKWRRKTSVDRYDVRRRPWYTQGASSPKEMLILVDRSGSSHGQALSLMKHSVKSILETVGENDFVNVASFSEKASLVSCFSTLVQGSPQNKQTLSEFVDKLTAGGVASYATGLEFAFQQLENFTLSQNQSDGEGAGCNQMIMFLTDGGTEMPVDILRKYNANKTVRIFSFAVGPVASAIPAVKWIGCSNRGFFYQIPAMGAIRSKVQDYLSYLARPQALAPDGHFTTSVHLDELGMGLVATATVPLFNQSQEIGNQTLLGILGVDISLKELVDSLPRDKFGPNGYAFAINSNGYVVFHPELKIPESTLGSPPSVDIVELEGETLEKLELRRDMIDQKIGRRHVKNYIIGLDEQHADVEGRTYYFRPIPNTNFSLAIVIPDYYKVFIESINQLEITTMHHLQQNNSLILLEYKRYCRSLTNQPMTLDLFRNFLLANYTTCDMNQVRHLLFDAEMVANLHQHWLRPAAMSSARQTLIHLPDGVVSVAVETNSGLTLVHPPNATALNYFETTLNPWDRIHYKRTSENNLWIYSTITKSDGNLTEKFILSTKAVNLDLNDYRTAAVSLIMTCQKFHEIVSNAVNLQYSRPFVSYILDDGGYIIYTSDPDLLPKVGEFFGELESSVMANLVKENFYISRVIKDYQRICLPRTTKNSGLRLFPSFLYELLSPGWWSSVSAWTYIQIYSWLFHETFSSSLTLEEEIIAEQNQRKCVMALHQYHFSLASDSASFLENGVISCQNCTRHYNASRLRNSNLLLVVVEKLDDCFCEQVKLPYQAKEIDNPLDNKKECDVTVRYRRKPPCYDENPNEPGSYCTGSSLTRSWRVLFLVQISTFLLSTHMRWQTLS